MAGLRDVEDIVDDLERQADVVAEIGERFQMPRVTVGAHAAEPGGTTEQGRGFAFVNVFELAGCDRLALTLEVGDLTGDQFERAGGSGQFQNDVAVRIARPAFASRGDFKRLREQRVAREDRDAFAEHFVIRQFSAAIIVVVHGRQIVVNQRVGVDALDRAGQRQGVVDGSAAGFRRRQTKGRAHAFAPGEQRVTHRPMDRRRSRRPFRQEAVEGAVDHDGPVREIGLEIERGPVARPGACGGHRHAAFLRKGPWRRKRRFLGRFGRASSRRSSVRGAELSADAVFL